MNRLTQIHVFQYKALLSTSTTHVEVSYIEHWYINGILTNQISSSLPWHFCRMQNKSSLSHSTPGRFPSSTLSPQCDKFSHAFPACTGQKWCIYELLTQSNNTNNSFVSCWYYSFTRTLVPSKDRLNIIGSLVSARFFANCSVILPTIYASLLSMILLPLIFTIFQWI